MHGKGKQDVRKSEQARSRESLAQSPPRSQDEGVKSLEPGVGDGDGSKPVVSVESLVERPPCKPISKPAQVCGDSGVLRAPKLVGSGMSAESVAGKPPCKPSQVCGDGGEVVTPKEKENKVGRSASQKPMQQQKGSGQAPKTIGKLAGVQVEAKKLLVVSIPRLSMETVKKETCQKKAPGSNKGDEEEKQGVSGRQGGPKDMVPAVRATTQATQAEQRVAVPVSVMVDPHGEKSKMADRGVLDAQGSAPSVADPTPFMESGKVSPEVGDALSGGAGPGGQFPVQPGVDTANAGHLRLVTSGPIGGGDDLANDGAAMAKDATEGDGLSAEAVSLPNAQDPDWGECVMGSLPPECPAIDFIRQQEEDSQQSESAVTNVLVDSCGAHVTEELPGDESVMDDGVGMEVSPVVPQGENQPHGGAVVNVQEEGGREVVGPELAGGDGLVPSPPRAVLPPSQEASLMSALREGRSFASVAGAQVKLDHLYAKYGKAGFRQAPGGQSAGGGTSGGSWQWYRGTGGPEQRRRNVVELRFVGSGPCPARSTVVDRVLGLGFKPGELFAVTHLPNTLDFDVSFMTPLVMEAFLTRVELVRTSGDWKDFMIVPLSRQEDIKDVTIMVKNESIPEQDVATWVRRYGDLQEPLRKDLDRRDVWTGAWRAKVKLRRFGNTVSHLPASAFIGRDRVIVFYYGQPRLCHKCGSPTHFSVNCTMQKCARCNGQGHTAEGCSQICCNLCGELGHPYSRCPQAFRGFTSGGSAAGGGGAGGSDGGRTGTGMEADPGEGTSGGSSNRQSVRGKKQGGGKVKNKGVGGGEGGEVPAKVVESSVPPLSAPALVDGMEQGPPDPGGGDETPAEQRRRRLRGGQGKVSNRSSEDESDSSGSHGSDPDWKVVVGKRKKKDKYKQHVPLVVKDVDEERITINPAPEELFDWSDCEEEMEVPLGNID